MEEFQQQFDVTVNFHSEKMKEKRNHFEKMPSFIKSGLYYSEKFKEMHNQQVWQKYFASDLLKGHGNQKFKNMDYDSACKFYEQALSVFRSVRNKRQNWRNEGLYDEDLEYFDENGKNDKEKKLVKGLKVILYQNICLVYLKLSKTKFSYINDAFQACNEAIKLDQKSSKAYYLRAKSRLHKTSLNNEDFKLSIKDFKKALELDPENQNIIDELQKCKDTYEKIKAHDFHSHPSSNKQNYREERVSAEPMNTQLDNEGKAQTKEKSNQSVNKQQEQMNDINKRKQQQSKRDDQNRKTHELWSQFRIEKTYSELNYDLSYEVIQKTVI